MLGRCSHVGILF